MSKKGSGGKAILPVVAASAFCGVLLYAAGRTLDYLFRDVDPKRIETEEEKQERLEREDKERWRVE